MSAHGVLQGIVDGLAHGRLTVYDLEQERFAGAPTAPVQRPGFFFGLHRRHAPQSDARTSASGVIISVDHFSTHVDAFCHQAYAGRMCGDVPVADAQTDDGFALLGAETIRPFVTRGVMIDVSARVQADLSTPIEMHEVAEAATAQAVEIRPGDVVLIRTGAGSLWPTADPNYIHSAGMAASTSKWLASLQVTAVGADNMAWDPVGFEDPELGSFAGHVLLLMEAGIYIFENLNLESLAEASVSEFLFVAAPLKIRGATGSPTRPIAIASAAPSKGGEGWSPGAS